MFRITQLAEQNLWRIEIYKQLHWWSAKKGWVPYRIRVGDYDGSRSWHTFEFTVLEGAQNTFDQLVAENRIATARKQNRWHPIEQESIEYDQLF